MYLKSLNEKTIFLLDGFGALLSSLIHLVLLPLINQLIGFPVDMHYILAAIPAVYCVYSFSCYFKANHLNSVWLKGIVVANFSYLLLTAYLLKLNEPHLKPLGWAYFVGEFIVIAMVIAIEYRVLVQIKLKKIGGAKS